MNRFLGRLLKFLAYAAGGVLILLAIAVGLFRLFLPRLPEYQEDIKGWASAAIGVNVEFSGMDARWGLSGPELEFYDAELLAPDSMRRIVAAEEVDIGLALTRLLFDRKAVVDRVVVRNTSLEVRQLENGQWWVQGSPPDKLLPAREGGQGDQPGGMGRIEVIGEDIDVQFLQPGDERPRLIRVANFRVRRDDVRMAIDAEVELPEDLGRDVSVVATQRLATDEDGPTWDISAEIDDLRLAGISALQLTDALQFDSGRSDVDLSLAIAGQTLQSATADIDARNVSIAGLTDLAVSGRVEFLNDEDGWLLAANEFRATTPAGEWPLTTLRLQTGIGQDDKIVTVDARASYFDFAQLAVARPWLNEQQRDMLAQFDPSGVVRNLVLTLSGLDSDAPRYSVSADMVDIGVAAHGKRPGVRGFSGNVRADSSSGLLDIDSEDLVVTAPGMLGEPLAFDTTSGTVIWRRSNGRTTVLSDSIKLRNAFFASETNVEVSLVDSGGRPFIDMESVFTVSDIAAARRFVPFMPKRPRMSEWFQEGLVSGRIEAGRARLVGDMNNWPFDDGSGQFLITGRVRDAVLVYQPKWPAAEVVDADIAVENMSLYSRRSRIINAGNEIVNANIEIADFRDPYFTLSALANGTMETLLQLSTESPINEWLGGQLDRIVASGDATAKVDLNVPIRDAQNFAYTVQLQAAGASVLYNGFGAPVTDLSGVVTIERDTISSESLGGSFLGRPVSVELSPAPETMPKYRIVADVEGAATTEALIAELGLPIADRVAGESGFTARLLFPRGKVDDPQSFRIELQSDLAGFMIDLPQPFNKPLYDTVDLSAALTVPKGGESIETSGAADELFSWRIGFNKAEDQWDLDRGIVEFGAEPHDASVPDTRGLHLRGRTGYVHLQEWFDTRRPDSEGGIADRVRSIDIQIDNLHMLGQHLVDHRLRIDRSAQDWLVQVDGDQVLGSASVPYDFNSGRQIAIEAERLVLPGDKLDLRERRTAIDPRSLPPISITTDEMAFGNRFIGAVSADFARTADGLESEEIIATDETFEIVGTARWVLDEADPEGHRTFLTASLTSTDVEKTMQRLDYNPGIVGDDLAMLLDLSWSGGPRDDLLEYLDGEVKVRIGAGQLADVKPGAGRVFGLMSVAALPRRLALDFRDVFSKGFGFDRIKGTFVIVDGDTYTCDLSLEGPAAEIGIVGRAGLATRDYEQTAVVSANFGNALPVAGALVAGPQVAAALLIFSQIFKKPLQEASQVYYGIGGTWDEPKIETTTAEIFALSGALAGCIEEAE